MLKSAILANTMPKRTTETKDQFPPACIVEVAWEVCNKVGGIHTVVSTKARTLVERFGDAYVVLGPLLLSQERENVGGNLVEFHLGTAR